MLLARLQRWRQAPWLAHWPAWLAGYFLLALLLDRLSGWQVASAHALLAGLALAVMRFRQKPKEIALFFLALLLAIAWMSFRDVLHGAGWKASERTLKAALLVLGMLACAGLPWAQWRLSLAAALAGGMAVVVAYVGPGQVARALLAPLEFGAAGGLATPMNRNGLALPLGLLSCWAVAAACQLRPRWLWLLPVAVLSLLMLANGSRNAIAALLVAVLFMLSRRYPGQVGVVGLGALLAGVVSYLVQPEYWVHGTLLSYRDVIWAEVFRHLPEHLWFGAGSAYFREVVAPALPIKVIIAHSAHLDFLLAYGLVGVLLFTLAGICLARLARAQPSPGQALWVEGSFVFLAIFGVFDRGHLDALMLAAMLMIPALLAALWTRLRR